MGKYDSDRQDSSPKSGRLVDRRSALAATLGAGIACSSEEAQPEVPQPALSSVRMIDLSVALENGAPGETLPPEIQYRDHEVGGQRFRERFGCQPSDLVYSNGGGPAYELINAMSHTGTHIDAPYHYGATSGGQPAKTIDQVPLEWCFGPGILLDFRHKQPGELIAVSDLKMALADIDHQLQPGEIVLIHTGASQKWRSEEYFRQPGFGRESTLWLVDQGIRMIGIDAWTLDRPFREMIADFQETGDGRAIWPAHFAGITNEYCQIEKLANLEEIPAPTGFYVSCFPVKIASASAGWCRAVALVPA